MAARESKKVICAAIIANVAIATGKFVAADLTGSSAMIAEAFHSTADTGNELLLLVGMNRSSRPPDELHPYGHGKALYFYSLLVAVYIFRVGGGLAVYHGITPLRNPQVPDHPGWNYAVLACAAAFEFYLCLISYRELRAQKSRTKVLGMKPSAARIRPFLQFFSKTRTARSEPSWRFPASFWGAYLKIPI